jgi:hypothetical protein
MKQDRWIDAGLALGTGGVLAGAAALVSAGNSLVFPGGRPVPPLCFFHQATGLDCPFCGMTRSFVASMHGEAAAAFGFHPAGPFTLAAIAAVFGCTVIFALLRCRPLWGRPGFATFVHVVAVGSLVVGLLRFMFE